MLKKKEIWPLWLYQKKKERKKKKIWITHKKRFSKFLNFQQNMLLLIFFNFPLLFKPVKIGLNSLKLLQQCSQWLSDSQTQWTPFSHTQLKSADKPDRLLCSWQSGLPWLLHDSTPLGSSHLTIVFSDVFFVVSKWRYCFTPTKYFFTKSRLFIHWWTCPILSHPPCVWFCSCWPYTNLYLSKTY